MEEFKVLQSEIARLTAENVKLHSENKTHRLKRKRTNEENATLKTEFDNARKQVEDLNNQVSSNPDEWRDKYETLRNQVTTDKHKTTFSKIAKELRVRDEAVEDLYSLSGYKVEGDEPDETAIKGLIGGVVKAKPYMISPEEPQQAKVPAPVKSSSTPGPGVARTSLESATKLKVSRADMKNFDFMTRHQKEISEGLKNNTMEIVD